LRPMRNVPERSEYHRLQVRLDEHLSQTQEHPYEGLLRYSPTVIL